MRCGADFGFSTDASVAVGVFIMGKTLYVRYEAYANHCDPDSLPSLFAGTDEREPARWLNLKGYPGIPNILRCKIIADSSRPDTIRHLQKRGFTIHGAKKGPGSVVEGVEFMQSFDIAVHPSCKHTINELENYSYKVDPHTEEVLPAIDGKDDHCIDSIRYAVESLRRSKGLNFAAMQTKMI